MYRDWTGPIYFTTYFLESASWEKKIVSKKRNCNLHNYNIHLHQICFEIRFTKFLKRILISISEKTKKKNIKTDVEIRFANSWSGFWHPFHGKTKKNNETDVDIRFTNSWNGFWYPLHKKPKKITKRMSTFVSQIPEADFDIRFKKNKKKIKEQGQLLGAWIRDSNHSELEAQTGRDHRPEGPEFRKRKKLWWNEKKKRNVWKYLGVGGAVLHR